MTQEKTTTRKDPEPISVAEADAYFAARPGADAWRVASETEKNQALTLAALTLDAACEFYPEARVEAEDGVVRWRPRVVAAFCEQAFWLLRYCGGTAETLAELGIARASVAGVEASFRSAGGADALACDMARRLVGRLGRFEPLEQGGTFSSAPLAL